MKQSVHVAITRKVKPALEVEFEGAIRNFFSTAVKAPGSIGAQLIKPLPGDSNNVYGIIRSFASQEDHDAFYASEQFSSWDEFIKPYVEPDVFAAQTPWIGSIFFKQPFQRSTQMENGDHYLDRSLAKCVHCCETSRSIAQRVVDGDGNGA